jgi:hypothetical protein
MSDYRAKLEAGMRKLAAAQRRDYENRRRGEQTYVSDLNVNDLAVVIAELLREQKADLLGHMNRLFQLSMSKSAAGDRDEDPPGIGGALDAEGLLAMTPREQHAFAQGAMVGAMLAYAQAQQELVELDQRLRRVEHTFQPLARRYRVLQRLVGGLVPVGFRDGERVFAARPR